jgi:hypothetical protein
VRPESRINSESSPWILSIFWFIVVWVRLVADSRVSSPRSGVLTRLRISATVSSGLESK